MKKDTSTPVHAWLVMMKAMQAITRYALANLEETGLGLSDFAVLEALLHKGTLPVNMSGRKVNLTTGSISVAVDRLVSKGLVSRAECSQDRRVRIVALTRRGKSVITPILRCPVGLRVSKQPKLTGSAWRARRPHWSLARSRPVLE